jgi:hypothetical protein
METLCNRVPEISAGIKGCCEDVKPLHQNGENSSIIVRPGSYSFVGYGTTVVTIVLLLSSTILR